MWASSVTPATAALATLNANALPEARPTEDSSNHSTVNPLALVGTVKDSGGNLLKFTDFTLTGTAGVYFVDSAGDLQTTLSAKTNNPGQIQVASNQSGASVNVVFTKVGSATITLTAGSATTPAAR